MKIKVHCCVPGCSEFSRWNILDYFLAALMTKSLKPYVCAQHHHLFDDVDISDYDPEPEDSATNTEQSDRV
jgi:hypothetical protein